MLKEIREYSNLGTPSFFYQIICFLQDNPSQICNIQDLRSLVYNKIIDGRSIFDGCFEVAFHIKLLDRYEDVISLNDILKPRIFSHKQITDKFNELLFTALKDDDDFYDIFSSTHLSYDIIYKSMQINNSAFGFKFSNFKQLLLDFEILQIHPTRDIGKYIINTRYKKLFDKTLLPEIKKRRIGVEELCEQIEQQQIYGEEAERFVLDFENKRLNNKRTINWIAEYIANEGYDIASYDNELDQEYNRFIEVKSYDGRTPYFYWSKNEFSVAKYRQNNYWIYLVNRSQMNKEGYIPEMIQNPYLEILESGNWNKEVEKYKITFIAK